MEVADGTIDALDDAVITIMCGVAQPYCVSNLEVGQIAHNAGIVAGKITAAAISYFGRTVRNGDDTGVDLPLHACTVEPWGIDCPVLVRPVES